METRQRKRHRSLRLTTASGNPVSAVGLGGNGWQEQSSALPVQALRLGINHFFCYSARTKSEEQYAPHPAYLTGLRALASTAASRDDLFFVGATRGRCAARLEQDLKLLCERAFSSARIDCFVLAFIGGQDGDDMATIMPLLKLLQSWKRAGWIRYVGASTHDFGLAVKLAATGLCDYLMCRYNMAHRRAEHAAFPTALQYGIPVVAFTTTRWNTLQDGAPGAAEGLGILERSAPTTGDCVAFARSHLAVHHAVNSCRDAAELAEVAERGPAAMSSAECEKWRAHGDLVYGKRKSSAYEQS